MQGKKIVSYAESSDEDDGVFSFSITQPKRRNRGRQVVDEDEYGQDDADEVEDDDGMLSHRKSRAPTDAY